MHTSSDIETLFGRFGGDATSYREIRMENEAQEARDRWPLLGMIDPRKVDVSAAGKSQSQTAAGPAGGPGPAGVAAQEKEPPPERSQAALRRSAPLFARSPRRDMTQVFGKPAHTAPGSSEFRFSPPPGTQASADEAAPPAPDEAVPVPPAANEAVAAPRVAPRNFGVPPLAPKVPLAAQAPAASPAVTSGGAPLRKLFGAASASAMPQGQAESSARPAAPEEHLDRLFSRLREGGNPEPLQGGGTAPKTAPARPWLSKGVNGP
jgi:resuscitation-promoting factor RpfA